MIKKISIKLNNRTQIWLNKQKMIEIIIKALTIITVDI